MTVCISQPQKMKYYFTQHCFTSAIINTFNVKLWLAFLSKIVYLWRKWWKMICSCDCVPRKRIRRHNHVCTFILLKDNKIRFFQRKENLCIGKVLWIVYFTLIIFYENQICCNQNSVYSICIYIFCSVSKRLVM